LISKEYTYPQHPLMNKPSREEFEKRFWERTTRRPPLPGQAIGCLCWTGTIRKRDGYGQVGWGRNNLLKPHRVAFEFTRGVVLTSNEHVLHSCDNPPCVEPSHLRIGTHRDNMADMAKRGRHHKLRGDSAPWSKLNSEAVRIIRAKEGEISTAALGELFGVTVQHIRTIQRGKAWREY
jgi:HNH endonuclease